MRYILRFFLSLFPQLRSNDGNKHQNNTWVSAWTVLDESTHIIVFLTWDKELITIKMMNFTHRPYISHSLGLHSVDDVTIDCWWHHKYITWCHNCGFNTWKVTSNSMDITFIHGHIHRRSCKRHWLYQDFNRIIYWVMTNGIKEFDQHWSK